MAQLLLQILKLIFISVCDKTMHSNYHYLVQFGNIHLVSSSHVYLFIFVLVWVFLLFAIKMKAL